MEALEVYRFRKRIPSQAIDVACKMFTEMYEELLVQDGIRANDSRPLADSPEFYNSWRNRHKGLESMLVSVGWECLMAIMLRRIPAHIWDSFWKASKARRTGLRSSAARNSAFLKLGISS
jgi:hypothetical protein